MLWTGLEVIGTVAFAAAGALVGVKKRLDIFGVAMLAVTTAVGGGMSRLRVSTVLDAPPEVVWADLEDISTHVEWMRDAVAIRFTSPHRSGVGTTFDCDTKVGPFRLTDRMEITEWRPRAAMGVRHVGIVTGSGRFTLRRARGGRTRFTWKERLVFPWYLGGPLGAVVGGEVLRLVWKRNLRNLRRRIEG